MEKFSNLITFAAVAMAVTGATLSVINAHFIFNPQILVYLGLALAIIARVLIRKSNSQKN